MAVGVGGGGGDWVAMTATLLRIQSCVGISSPKRKDQKIYNNNNNDNSKGE